MVRILRVKHLKERRCLLLARSEIYRKTLAVEVANLKYSAGLLKQKMNPLRSIYRLLRHTAPFAASLLLARKAPRVNSESFLGRVLSGVKMAGELMSVFRGSRSEKERAE